MNIIATADLLRRKERTLDMRRVRDWLHGKLVAITGAGGFIGSELARQIATHSPSQIILIDNCEHNLYQVTRQLQATPVGLQSAFGDVRDIERMNVLLAHADIIVHAAAMKHVPICEDAPAEAWRTNFGGTLNVICASDSAQLVMVSTDKACNPSSTMGATKMRAEDLMRESGRAAIVRFGNVIGSTGSVVPLFREQIERGGPVTVTDPEMTRYFMTVGEAAELILQAGASGKGTYVLDMGTPVKIMDLARDMIALSGRRDIEIQITGIRPGEKLHEELSAEPLKPTGIDGVCMVTQ